MDPLGLALGSTLILILVARRFRLPPIPLYLVAGLAAGDSGLGWLSGNLITAYLGHLGLVFLLFYAGLELKPERFLSLGQTFCPVGFLISTSTLPWGSSVRWPWVFPLWMHLSSAPHSLIRALR